MTRSAPRERVLADIVARARTLVAARPGATVWIGIDGRGAAGKTTLAGQLAARIPGAVVVHVDDFSGPQVAEWDWERFARQLRDPLLAGRAARYQVWDWDRDAGGRWEIVEPGRPVIVEGVSSTRAEAAVPWDVRVWVDAPRTLRLQRALERDGQAAMPRWLDDWMPSEERYVAQQRPDERADYVISGVESETAP